MLNHLNKQEKFLFIFFVIMMVLIGCNVILLRSVLDAFYLVFIIYSFFKFLKLCYSGK